MCTAKCSVHVCVCVGGGGGGRNMCSLWEGLGENTAIMSSGGVSLAGAATGIIFVATKQTHCCLPLRDKIMFCIL